MSDERPTSSNPGRKSWLDRLSDAFTGEPKDRDDLLTILNSAQENDILDNEAFKIIEGALNVSDMHVRDIMIPRFILGALFSHVGHRNVIYTADSYRYCRLSLD